MFGSQGWVPHVPWSQYGFGPGQGGAPQAPQFLMSFCVLTQAAPQQVNPMQSPQLLPPLLELVVEPLLLVPDWPPVPLLPFELVEP